jgi:hypothetical protein
MRFIPFLARMPGPKPAGWLAHARRVAAALWLAGLALTPAHAQELPEYRLKAAFIYNFAAFTEWPAETGPQLNLCVFGADPFGPELDALAGKKVGERSLVLQRKAPLAALKTCQIVFVCNAESAQLPRVLEAVRGLPVLTVTDTPGATRQGAVINMALAQGRITFEANLVAARAARLTLSSKLLRLATEVVQ